MCLSIISLELVSVFIYLYIKFIPKRQPEKLKTFGELDRKHRLDLTDLQKIIYLMTQSLKCVRKVLAASYTSCVHPEVTENELLFE